MICEGLDAVNEQLRCHETQTGVLLGVSPVSRGITRTQTEVEHECLPSLTLTRTTHCLVGDIHSGEIELSWYILKWYQYEVNV